MAERPLADLLKASLLDYPHIIGSSGGNSQNPQEILQQADQLAETLRSVGLACDEPVIVTIRTAPADLASFLGVWQAGGVAVPVHAAAAPLTMQAVEEQSSARWIVRDGQISATGTEQPASPPTLQGAALVIFTSGSTGKPKGVVIGHERLAKKIEALGRLLQLRPTDHIIVPLQLTFIFGLWAAFLALASTARLTLVSKFSPDELKPILDDGATVLAAVPSMLRAILSGSPQPSMTLRLILTGGEALGPALTERLIHAYPSAGIYDLYGLTETGSCDFTLAPEDLHDGVGTIGIATEAIAFRIMGDAGPVESGDTGELQIASPFGMLGYLNQPELTRISFADGFFRTGDLARQRPDGRVELVGRSKEIISRGGNKIAPLEIDYLLAAHPGVSAALCAGVPDSRLGEAIHAVVVPKEGARITPEIIRIWLAERIERFKLPDVIEISDSLPTGPTGKASRAALAQRAITKN